MKFEKFLALKKSSLNEHLRHRFVIFHRLRFVKGGAKRGTLIIIFSLSRIVL